MSACETVPGIGLCDDCGLPKRPQEYDGCGHMVCLDCIAEYDRRIAERKVLGREHAPLKFSQAVRLLKKRK